MDLRLIQHLRFLPASGQFFFSGACRFGLRVAVNQRLGLEFGLQPDVLALEIGKGCRAGLCIGIKGNDLRFEVCQCRLVGRCHRIGLQIADLGIERLDLGLQPVRLRGIWRCRDDLRFWS